MAMKFICKRCGEVIEGKTEQQAEALYLEHECKDMRKLSELPMDLLDALVHKKITEEQAFAALDAGTSAKELLATLAPTTTKATKTTTTTKAPKVAKVKGADAVRAETDKKWAAYRPQIKGKLLKGVALSKGEEAVLATLTEPERKDFDAMVAAAKAAKK